MKFYIKRNSLQIQNGKSGKEESIRISQWIQTSISREPV